MAGEDPILIAEDIDHPRQEWQRKVIGFLLAAVSGTGLLAGYVLYALMLRRALYRQVSVTSLQSMD